MDWRKIKEHWASFQVMAQREWPELGAEALEQSHGDRTELIRRLVETYRMSQEEATLAVDRWADDLTSETDFSPPPPTA